MLKNRRSRLSSFFDTHSLDVILLTNLVNIRYLCGFSGSEGALLLTRDRAWFLCDSRYTSQASLEVEEAEIREFSAKYEAICELISTQGFHRVGIEAGHVVVSDYQRLEERLEGRVLVPLDSALDAVRSCKDDAEVCSLAEVAELSSGALLSVLDGLRPGISEVEFSLMLEIEMRRRGADGRAFDFIVASGERGALPHGRASKRLMCSGELVTVDFGAVSNGYYSDETVTVALGKVDSRAKEIHAIVLEAHDRAIAAVRPGISCRELDEIARGFIREQGYSQFFGHGLGHGVGLEIHEKPVISPRGEAVIEEGMVFTIEPGIYIPDFGGVRIEDTVLVTREGCQILTKVPKQMMEL